MAVQALQNAKPLVGAERRNRRKVIKGARIVFNSGGSSIACIVRELSPTGATLRVESVVGIPNEFELLFDDRSPPRNCRVVNRRGMLGVVFVAP
jgi:hypothetical protein